MSASFLENATLLDKLHKLIMSKCVKRCFVASYIPPPFIVVNLSSPWLKLTYCSYAVKQQSIWYVYVLLQFICTCSWLLLIYTCFMKKLFMFFINWRALHEQVVCGARFIHVKWHKVIICSTCTSPYCSL
jgi:hypothetical protein